MTASPLPPLIYTDAHGHWVLKASRFRNFIPSEHFPAEKGRYVLYVNYCCPWSHRAVIAHGIKGLEDIVQMVEVDARDNAHGWWFSGHHGPDRDPIYGVKYMRDLYLKADSQYNGRVTVPLLWDKKHETIVNNDSGEIARMFFGAFDKFLPSEKQEAAKGEAAFIPKHLESDIDILNAWVFDNINNGVYKTGFATTQSAYNENVLRLFQGLDRLEYHLSQPGNAPYLFGEHITESDIRLFPTIIRFDAAYYTLFKCNMKMIRTDYPRLHDWVRNLYWNEGPETNGGVFQKSTNFDLIKRGYSSVVAGGNGVIPIGPVPSILPL